MEASRFMLIDLIGRYIYRNKVSKETFWAAFAKIASVAGGLFIVFFVPRFAGVDIYGGFMLLIAYITVAGIFFGDSLSFAVKKELAEEKFSAVAWRYFTLGILLKLICSMLSTVLLVIFIELVNIQIVREHFVLFVVLNVLTVLWGSVAKGFEAVHRLFYVAVIYCIEYGIKVVSILWFYRISRLTVDTLLLSFIAGYGAAFVVGLMIFIVKCKPTGPRDFFTLDSRIVRKLLKRGFFLALTSVAAVILVKVDSIMISYYLEIKDVGFYNIASVIAKNAILATIPLVLGAAPMFVQISRPNKLLVQTIRNIAVVNVGLFFIFVLSASYIVKLIYGDMLSDSIYVLQILALYPLFCVLQMFFQQILILRDKLKGILVIGLGAVAVDITLNMLMIRPLGIAGAAYATVFSFFLWALGLFFYLKKCL